MTNQIMKVSYKKLKEFNTMLPLQLQVSSKEHQSKLYCELGFGLGYYALHTFYKLKTSGLPKYLFDLIQQTNYLYSMCFWKMLQHFKVELILSSTLFSSTISEWNKFDRMIQQFADFHKFVIKDWPT